jgi:tetratricopeptide (TPR) repeat protein
VPTQNVRKAETEVELRQKLANGSQDPEDYGKLAIQVFVVGGLEEAITLYKQAIELSPTGLVKARVYTDLEWLYYEMGQRDQALAMTRSALGLLFSRVGKWGSLSMSRWESVTARPLLVGR